jgi:glycosyltransferase involved in cell wall biosynthesis
MNVLLVTQHLDLGGVETHVATLARHLRATGHCVVIASQGGLLATQLIREGVRCYQIAVVARTSTAVDQAVDEMRQIIDSERIDVVHIHHFLPLLVGVLAAVQAGRPWVVTVHGAQPPTVWMWEFGPWYYDFCCFALQHASSVIAVSDTDIAAQVRENYLCDGAHVVVIPNAIDLADFPFQPAWYDARAGTRPLQLVCVSRMDHDKRRSILGALALLDDLLARGHAAALTFVGDGTIRAEIEAVSQTARRDACAAGSDIRFVGAQRCVAPFLSEHDVVIGMGRVILEGAAVGRVTVLSGLHGLADLVTPANYAAFNHRHFSGRHLPVADASALNDRILALLADPAGRRAHLEALRCIVETAHSAARAAARCAAWYEKAAPDAGACPHAQPSPALPEAVRQRGQAWHAAVCSGAAQRGEDDPRRRMREMPSTLAHQTALAQRALLRGDAATAEPALRQVLREQPDCPPASDALAGLLLGLQRPAAAIEVLEAALAGAPQHTPLWWQRGQALLALGRYAEARCALDAALRYQPANAHLVGARLACDVQEQAAIIQQLQASLAEQTTWNRALRQQVDEQSAEIGRLQGLLAEQTAWAQRAAADVAQRDDTIQALQARRDQDSWSHAITRVLQALRR